MTLSLNILHIQHNFYPLPKGVNIVENSPDENAFFSRNLSLRIKFTLHHAEGEVQRSPVVVGLLRKTPPDLLGIRQHEHQSSPKLDLLFVCSLLLVLSTMCKILHRTYGEMVAKDISLFGECEVGLRSSNSEG